MPRATTSLPVPLSPSSRTGRRLRAAFSIRRRIAPICGESPTRPWLKAAAVEFIKTPLRSRQVKLASSLSTRQVYSYDEGGFILRRILPDAGGQRLGGLLGGFLAHQNAPKALFQHHLRAAIASLHPGADALGVGPVAERAYLDGKSRGRHGCRSAEDFDADLCDS